MYTSEVVKNTNLDIHLQPLHPRQSIPQSRVQVSVQSFHNQQHGGTSVVFVVNDRSAQAHYAGMFRSVPGGGKEYILQYIHHSRQQFTQVNIHSVGYLLEAVAFYSIQIFWLLCMKRGINRIYCNKHLWFLLQKELKFGVTFIRLLLEISSCDWYMEFTLLYLNW